MPNLGERNFADQKYTFVLWMIFVVRILLCLSGQGRGALAAMTLYFISWRTGALIGQ